MTYDVIVPIAGHCLVNVDASSEEEAKALAMEQASNDNLESWECLESFSEGNICFCPKPWKLKVESNDT